MEPPIKQIVLPPSKDGYYRFGELLGLIADARYPSDDHPHGYLTKVVIWRPSSTRTGEYYQCIPPGGARLTDFTRLDEWTVTRIYADRVRPIQTRSTVVDSTQNKEDDGKGKRKKSPEPLERIYWAYDRRLIRKQSKSQQRFWPDGSLVVGIEINDEATGSAWNWAMEQDWYEAELTAVAQLPPGDPGRLQVVDKNRNEIEFRDGPWLKQGYIHITWLNEWGARKTPKNVFVNGADAPETDTPSSDLASPPSDSNRPLPLTTSTIAHVFDGLRWTEREWKKPLGDKPKWLRDCVAIPGQRGVSETHWNPVFIGGALVLKKGISVNRVRARFQSRPLLQPWREDWKTYEADHLDTD